MFKKFVKKAIYLNLTDCVCFFEYMITPLCSNVSMF